MNKAYNAIDWKNEPNTSTPINDTNLNKMDRAIDTIDDRVIDLDEKKANIENQTFIGTTKYRETSNYPYGFNVEQDSITYKTPTDTIKVNNIGVYLREVIGSAKAEYTKDGISMSKYGKTTTVEAGGIVSGGDVTTGNGVSLDWLNNNLVEQKMLGWSVPSECPVQNEVNGNQFTQRVGRIDLGSVNYTSAITQSGTDYYRFNVPNCKYNYANDVVPNYYLDGYKSISYNETWFDKCLSRENTNATILDFAYSDTSAIKNGMKGKYFYYELETPITMTIDGNEAIEQINESLADYGLVNKFDGAWLQGYYNINKSGAFTSDSTFVCNANAIKCASGNVIRFKFSQALQSRILYFNGNNYVSSSALSALTEASYTVPSGVDNFKFYVYTGSAISPSTVGKTVIYVGNEIDKLKNDLSNYELFKVFLLGSSRGIPNVSSVSLSIDISEYKVVSAICYLQDGTIEQLSLKTDGNTIISASCHYGNITGFDIYGMKK